MPQLPHFCQGGSSVFFNAALFGKSILFSSIQKNAFREHDLHEIIAVSVNSLWEQAGMLPIFVFHSIIQARAPLASETQDPFIVPGTQMYLHTRP